MPTPPPTLAPTPPIGGASSSNGTCPTNGTAESMIDDFIGIGGASSSDGTRVARVRQNDNENAGTSRRRLQVYDVMDGGWTQVGNDLIESATKDWFGSAVAFSSDGSRIAVGAPGSDNENGKDAGKVQIYDLMEGRWTQIGNDLIGGADREYFGDALAFSADGTRLVVGTTLNDNENGKDAGLVLVYDLMEGTWTQVGNELIGSATFDWFGKAVALSSDGTRLVVGATGNDNENGEDTGLVQVYDMMEGTWIQVGNDLIGSAYRQYFGSSVALSSDGSRLAVGGSWDEDEDGNYAQLV